MDERELVQLYLRARLAAEKQIMDVVRKVRDGEGEFVLLDTRDRNAWERGRIPGALPFPATEAEALAADLDPEREYVTYCWAYT
jgi:rhodanese-related sulfurtransferase